MGKRIVAIIITIVLSIMMVMPVAAQETVDNENGQEILEQQEDGTFTEKEELIQEDTTQEDVVQKETENDDIIPDELQDNVEGNEETERSDDETDTSGGVNVDIPENGWYQPQDSINKYFYVNGVMIKDTIYEIDNASYVFHSDGALIVNSTYYYSYQDEQGMYKTICCRADEEGKLIKGWYKHQEYYGDDFARYEDHILEEEGSKYYFGKNGQLLVNSRINIGEKVYEADDKGRLTELQEILSGWQKINGSWFWYENGQYVKDTFITNAGKVYYLDVEGCMLVGVFEAYDKVLGTYRSYLAENNGAIVVHDVGWYFSQSFQSWFYFKEKSIPARDEIVKVNGKKYYLKYNGEMAIGLYDTQVYNPDTGQWETQSYLTNSSGAIYEKQGWIKENSNWYYFDAKGKAFRHVKADINGKTYLFDYNGVMQIGRVYFYEGNTPKQYITDSSGAIIKNGWTKWLLEWYYTDEEGAILTNQWILEKKYYVGYSGAMATGLTYIDGEKYMFSDNGLVQSKIGTKSGWELQDGIWFYYTEEGKPYNGWLNHTYYIDDGRMVINDMVNGEDKEETSWVGCDGKKAKGWIKIEYDGRWIYADSKGNLVHDKWEKINGKWYYFEDVIMLNYGKVIDGDLWDIASNGAYMGKVSGKNQWKKLSNGDWYYFKANGVINTDAEKIINGKKYYFFQSGKMKANCFDGVNNEEFYINASGNQEQIKGWKKIDGFWYYFENGKRIRGLRTINGKQYYLEPMMRKGSSYVEELGRQCFFDDSGAMQKVNTGWYWVNNPYQGKVWYYFENGSPVNGVKSINGKNYFFSYGTMMSGPSTFGNNTTYVLDENGQLVKNRWVKIRGNWFYGGPTGRAYVGERIVNGRKYWFDLNGIWVK